MKTLKRPLSIVLSIAMVFCMVACLPLTVGAVGGAFAITSDAEANTVKTGDSFNVTIKLDGTGKPTNSLKFTVTYDSAVFELDEASAKFDDDFVLSSGATNGDDISLGASSDISASLKDVTVADGKVTFTVVNIEKQLIDEQTVATLTFKAKEAAASSDITVTPAENEFVVITDGNPTIIADAYKDAVPVSMVVESNGPVMIWTIGDVNGDGNVDGNDATVVNNLVKLQNAYNNSLSTKIGTTTYDCVGKKAANESVAFRVGINSSTKENIYVYVYNKGGSAAIANNADGTM